VKRKKQKKANGGQKMRYMTTTKSRPVSVMDQLIDSMLYDAPAAKTWRSFPVDVLENEENYQVSAELPGFVDEEVDVTLNDNLMVITAGKKEDEKVENAPKYLIRERVQGQYKRSFSLPKDADRESIKATLKEGVLNLTIGKKPEAKPLNIKIN
jgi:HSP20 family molecular chaperone IbpA